VLVAHRCFLVVESVPRFCPRAKRVYPTARARIRRWVANAQTEELTRELFAALVCESGGVYFEMGYPFARSSQSPQS
jgi:hypothetical protein